MKTRGRPKGFAKKDNRSYGPLGDLIREHRLAKRMGLADVATACGCSVQFISNIEHGRAPLPWDKVPALAQSLGISVEEIQAANLTIRADLKVFTSAAVGKKVPTPLVLKNLASTIAFASQDTALQEMISRYQAASKTARKEFVKAAMGMLPA